MKFLSFEISKYRAIDHVVVPVSNSLIPIIGINESGKTTVLQAILAFDRSKDRYNGGKHLDYKNVYVTGKKDAYVAASVILENDDDVDCIAGELSLAVTSQLYKTLRYFHENGKEIKISRNLNTKYYSVLNDDLKEGKGKGSKLANAIFKRLPFILYFDDFSDRVPESVAFPLDFNTRAVYSVPTGRKNIEWHLIIEEVFNRATEEGIDLKEFIVNDDLADQKGIISDIEDDLQKKVVEDWKNLKRKYGKDFGEEGEDLQINLESKISDNRDKITFAFKVTDRSTGKGRHFNIAQRSKGFQWFFNFIMKLKYNPKYQSDLKGAIYLLDEPGSYLHNSAQEELLKKLKEISETNTILYCTHSEYLLDPDIINVAKIKIAQRESGNIDLVPMDSAGKVKTEGAFTPLYQALHKKSGFFEKKIKYQVITEGITDYYLFSLLKKYKKNFFNEKIAFIPGAGATHLKDLISNAIAFSERYLVILDSDKEGRDAYSTYSKHFGSEEEKNFFKLKTKLKEEDVVLEDLLSDATKKQLQSITGVSDTKTAIPAIYFMTDKNKQSFIESLDGETLENLSIIKGKANGLLK